MLTKQIIRQSRLLPFQNFSFATQNFPTGLKKRNIEKEILTDDSQNKKITRELQDSLDYENCQTIRDAQGPYCNPNDGFIAKYMGRGYIYRMPQRLPSENPQRDTRDHRIDQMMVVKKFMVGMQMHKQPKIRFPVSTHRITGRVNPGEVERKQRKMLERKATRSDVELLCKYMLWKNNKFMPGKMV